MENQDSNTPIQITLKKGINDLNTVLAGLGELPAKVSYPLIKDLEAQFATIFAHPKEE